MKIQIQSDNEIEKCIRCGDQHAISLRNWFPHLPDTLTYLIIQFIGHNDLTILIFCSSCGKCHVDINLIKCSSKTCTTNDYNSLTARAVVTKCKNPQPHIMYDDYLIYMKSIRRLQGWIKNISMYKKIIHIIPQLMPLYYHPSAKGGYFHKKYYEWY